MTIDKAAVLDLIIGQLGADLAALEAAVALSHDTATHADCLGSSKYETMGLEASYLAQGQGVRLLEIERALEQFRRISPGPESDRVGLSSLLSLIDEEGDCQWFWIAREAGGLKVGAGDDEVTVITPQSPLGRALMGHRPGDEIEVRLAGRQRSFELVELF